MLNIGIIGVGRIGSLHAKSVTYNIPSAKVLGITDVNAANSQAVASELGIEKIYDDYRQMLADPEIDAVMICSSTDTHADIAVEAAAAGKHIFCEKPVDLTPEKVYAVIEAVQKAGVKLQVGFNRRFDHNFARIEQMTRNGEIGDVHIIKITSRDPAPPPAEYSAVSGGMFLDMTIHDFDMARFLAGSEVTEVYANATCLVDPAIGEAGDVDTAVISLTFANGAVGVIDNSRKAVYGYDQRVEVFGSKGTLYAQNDTPNNVTLMNECSVSSEKPLYFFLERYMQSFRDEVLQFIDAIQNGKNTPTSVDDGLKSLLVALAAKESVAAKRPVPVKY
ncbi:MAG TPA: inositol 2-dehydrogenase [Clostridiales bacterium]|nr:inositol 2-dehydrogenase [Clostridiales bacterium]HQK74497.1 inositol 2-dehydrogenase [Clostridiales bacterium]